MSLSTPVNGLPFQPNPFGSAASGSPWIAADAPFQADVAAINRPPFLAIVTALNQVRAGAGAGSLIVTGEPGSGKTHLLGRLRARLERDEREGLGDTVYIYVRCNASAATLWRHLRHAVALDLLKLGPDRTRRIARLLRQQPERMDRVAQPGLRRALEAIRDGRHFHAAASWLRGEALADTDLTALGLALEQPEEEGSREADARRFVDELLQFCAPTPTVLCFDQVEALQTYIGEENGFHAMGQMVSALVDGHPHLLLISCIVSAFEDMFDRLPNGADRDRWLQSKVNLRPIAWEQALELVSARLESAPALTPLRKQHAADPLWPLDRNLLKPLFKNSDACLPRKLIQNCKQQFELLLSGEAAAPAEPIEVFLQEKYAAAFQEARKTVARQGSDKTLTDCLPWLLQNSGCEPLPPRAAQAKYASQAYSGPVGDLAMVFCYGKGNQLYGKLRRTESHWAPQSFRLKILRDPAVPLGKVGASLLAKLKEKGAEEVHPLPEAVAALQAIRNLVAAARSGELFQGSETLSEAQVNEWALANLPRQLDELRDQLIGKPRNPVDTSMPRLAALLSERKIMDAEAAAAALSLPAEEVKDCARRHPMRFGLLVGPPVVLFEVVFETAEDSSGPTHA